MTAHLIEFLTKSAAMLPVMLFTGAACWWLGRKTGLIDPGRPFNASDLRTWPFVFTMVIFVVFALVHAAASTWIGPDLAAALGAFVSIGLAPPLIARFCR